MSSTTQVAPTESHVFNLTLPMTMEAKMPKLYPFKKANFGIFAFLFVLVIHFFVVTSDTVSDFSILTGFLLITFGLITFFEIIKAPRGWVKENNQMFKESAAAKDLANHAHAVLNLIYQLERDGGGDEIYYNAPFDTLNDIDSMEFQLMIVRPWENYRMMVSGKKNAGKFINDIGNWAGFAAMSDDKTYCFDPKFLDAYTYVVDVYVKDEDNS